MRGHSRFGRLLSRARAVSAFCLHLTPPKDAGLDGLPGCPVPPLPVYVLTREWKDVCADVILCQNLHWQPRAWISFSPEVLQTGRSCHHPLAPIYSDASIDPWDNATEEARWYRERRELKVRVTVSVPFPERPLHLIEGLLHGRLCLAPPKPGPG